MKITKNDEAFKNGVHRPVLDNWVENGFAVKYFGYAGNGWDWTEKGEALLPEVRNLLISCLYGDEPKFLGFVLVENGFNEKGYYRRVY